MKKIDLTKALISINGNLSPDVIKNLSPDVIKNLSPDVIKNLSPDVINNLSPDVINNLSPYVIKNLSPYVIKNLSPYVIKNLSPYVINNLSPDVIKNLSLVNNIPVIPNQYAALLKEIEGNPAIYKQSTFGELNDAKANVCKSPMCIAGHQVHMAGEEGYAAKKKFGYPTTAALVHLKAYPNAPVFNYMLADNASGLLFIKMMAEFDNRKNKKQTFCKWFESAFKAAE